MAMATRALPAWVAPVAAHLELEEVSVIRTSDVAAAAKTVGVASAPRRVVQELANNGWLLPTGIHGVWEFVPASHGGAHSRSDPFLTLRAALVSDPPPGEIAVALRSAMWQRDLLDRPPNRHELAVPKMSRLNPGLERSLRRNYRLTSFETRLPPEAVSELPVHRLESVLVQLAERPTAVEGWDTILDTLDDLGARCDLDNLITEVTGRTHATLMRLAYLTANRRPELVGTLGVEPRGVVWFGPHGKVRRHDRTWNLVDTLLPRHPDDP